MSGIYGYINLEHYDPALYNKALGFWNKSYGKKEMVWQDDSAALGVNLEHFSDSVPCQKSMLENEKYVAVVDALLYNRKELSELYGSEYIALSDEEIIFRLVTEKGISAIAMVNGDFSCALWDKQERKLLLFRDHMGIRPIYYYKDDKKFIFATDMRGILAVPGLEISMDERFLFETMICTAGLFPTETDYEQIRYARRASWFTVSSRDNQIRMSEEKEYWTLKRKKIKLKDERAYVLEHRKRIEEAVKRRMDAIDGLLGSEISGGLDSSVLSILLGRLGREGRYFSWSYDPSDWPIQEGKDERKIIEDICRQENINVTYRRRNDPIGIHTTEELLDRLHPPFINTEQISMASAWFQSEGVKAVLTGHGGDEGVSHRCDFYELWYHKEYLNFLRAIYRTRKGNHIQKLYRTIKETARRLIKVHPHISEFSITDDNLLDLMNPEYRKRMIGEFQMREFPFFYDVVKDFEMGGPRERMDNTALQAAQYGVRYLYPYLDYQLIEYCVSIPRYLFNNGRGNRWIYKEAFKDIMPRSLIRDHSKRTTSVSGEKTEITKEMIHIHNKNAKEVIHFLRRDFWEKYLDFDKLEHLQLPDDATSQDIRIFFFKYCNLTYCVMAENILRRAGEPVFKGEN